MSRALIAAPLRAAVLLVTIAMLASAMTGTAQASSASQPDPSTCVSDAGGDTRDGSNGSAAAEPRADIVEHCAAYVGRDISLSVRVASPTPPSTDAAWQDGTFAGWFVDIDEDGEGEYLVNYSLDQNSNLRARVTDISDPGNERDACTATATFADGFYTVSGIPRVCIGSPDGFRSSPAMFYDTVADGGPVFRDDAPFQARRITPQTDVRATARLAGSGRETTAVAISQRQFPNGAQTAYLARADVFADAVAGGSLTDGPILLVPNCGTVLPAVIAEIQRLDPTRVVALGGQAAICDSVLAQASAQRQSDRLAGQTRIGTAIQISQAQFPASASTVFLARDDQFADAVAGGTLTAGPTLLVPTCGAVPTEVFTEINRLNPQNVIALGGQAAICDVLLAQASLGRQSSRLAGPGRVETAVEISKFQFATSADTVYLARADVFADAVAGGSLTGGPILLVPSTGELPTAVAGEIARLDPPNVVALGGASAVSDQILDAAAAA